MHVPTEPATLHDLHVSVHAALQQTPSVQKPLRHWPAVEHADPLGRLLPPPPPVHEPDPLHSPVGHSFCGSVPFRMNPQAPLLPPVSAPAQALQS